jgi:hypothetical protein
VDSSPSDGRQILYWKGIRQGKSLEPLLFGVVLQSVLEHADAAQMDSKVLVLHDNACLWAVPLLYRLQEVNTFAALLPLVSHTFHSKYGILGTPLPRHMVLPGSARGEL